MANRLGNILTGFLSLGKQTNKISGNLQEEQQEGVIGALSPELSMDKTDEELIELKKSWEKKWDSSKIRKDFEEKQKENEKYWLGDHWTSAQKKVNQRQPVNNLIFEALETFLPVITKQVAEPLVESVQNPLAQQFAKKVADRLSDLADEMRLRLKIKKAIRYWSLYYFGAIKLGWSMETDDITVEAVRPQLLILDPDALTDECEYNGEFIGHYRTDSATDLIARFPNKRKELMGALGKEALGTKLRYIEWWTNDFVFWTLRDEVLAKIKNPHWNYDSEEQVQVGANELGEPIMGSQTIVGRNHLKTRKIPFAILSVFSLGRGPMDETSLIEQVLPLQDIINKRVRQIDKNADNTNSGSVVSGDAFTKEQARDVGEALRRGQTIWVPAGDVNRAYKRDVAPPLPQFVYQDLLDTRDQIRGTFGITGISAQGIKSEETVRGKILVREQDSSRAGLIIDHIEQYYDYIFNWIVQLMMVYYDTPKSVTKNAEEMIQSSDFIYPLLVSVKEGSLIPKDRLTKRNEAIELWTAGAIDPLTLAERLEEPDPKEFVRRLIAWKLAPMTLAEGSQQSLPQVQAEMPQIEEQNILNQVPIQ